MKNQLLFLLAIICCLVACQPTTDSENDDSTTVEQDDATSHEGTETTDSPPASDSGKDSPEGEQKVDPKVSKLILTSLYGDSYYEDEQSIEFSPLDHIPEGSLPEAFSDAEVADAWVIFAKKVDVPPGDLKTLFVVKSNVEGNDCHACSPLVSAGVMDDAGKIEKHIYLGPYGVYGEAPYVEAQPISREDWGLELHIGDLHMGYFVEYYNLHSMKYDFKKLYSTQLSEDNNGTCDPDGTDEHLGECYEWETKLTYKVMHDPEEHLTDDYYNIVAHTTGTRPSKEDRNKIEKVDEKATYAYRDGSYQKQ